MADTNKAAHHSMTYILSSSLSIIIIIMTQKNEIGEAWGL